MEKEKEKDKTKHIPISQVLEKVLEQDLYEKYRKKLGFSPTADYLYQWALISLNESNSDKAISFMISALDIDRRHGPTLHLVKSMLIGLGKEFYEKGGSDYKQKYPDLSELADIVRKKAVSVKKKCEKVKREVRELEKMIDSGNVISKFFKRIRHEKSLLLMKNQMMECLDKLEQHKKELKKVRRFQKNEEYSKILGTIIEICILPKRYNWASKEGE